MSGRLVTLLGRLFTGLVCFLLFGARVPASQMHQLDSQLESEDWHERAAAYYRLRASLKGAKGDQSTDQFLALLERENSFLDSRSSDLNMTDSKARVADQENYAEYYAQVLESANAVSDLRNTHDLSILASSVYNPDSPFAKRLVDQSRQDIIPVLSQLTQRKLPAKRANALALLGYAYRSLDLAPPVRDEIRQALLRGIRDADPMVRQEVVRAIGETGDTNFLPVLASVSREDKTAYVTGAGGRKRFPVREEALKAMQKIQTKKP